MKFRNKLIKGIAISMAFTTMLTSTAFATPIDLRDSVLDVQYDTLNQDTGTTYYTDENNEWANGTINEEVRVRVNLASKFDITIPKDIVLNGETGEANYIVNAKGDIAGDQILVVEPENEFLLSEKGGKADITATVIQENIEYTYTELQGTGTDYNGLVKADLSAGEWHGKFKFNISFNEQGLPEPGQPLESYSWDEIATISEAGLADEYFNVGDEKTITLNSTSTASLNTLADEGETYTLQIIGLNHDDLADGSGKASITFQFKECISSQVMNSNYSDKGGWRDCEIRTYVNKNIYNSLSLEIRDKIKEVLKKSDIGTEDRKTLTSTTDKLFLLSVEEVGVVNSGDVIGQGENYKFYSSNTSRIKYKNGAKIQWWLRSTGGSGFRQIMTDGRSGSNHAGGVRGVAPAFCI